MDPQETPRPSASKPWLHTPEILRDGALVSCVRCGLTAPDEIRCVAAHDPPEVER